MDDETRMPRFKVDKSKNPPVVWLCCSQCHKKIRKIGMKEEIDVRRGYYCNDCDDGTIRLNN